jgi:hypothetical protein
MAAPSRLDRARSRVGHARRRVARGAGGPPREGSLPQAVAVLAGLLLALIGALGFLVTGFDDFAGHNPVDRLFGLAVNPLQNVLHLAVGVLGMALSGRRVAARCFGWLLALGLGAVFVFGLVAVDRPDLNVLNVNWAGNWLHLIGALAGLAAAVGPARVGRIKHGLRRRGSG